MMMLLLKLISAIIKINLFFIMNIIWLVVALPFAFAAKKSGMSFLLTFCLIFFLRFIGLVIFFIMLVNSDKKPNERIRSSGAGSRRSANDSYFEASNPYANPNRRQTSEPSRWQRYGDKLHTCPSCGNVQENKGFCMICGAQIK